VKVERGHIVVDEYGRTGEPGVYAIGDVVGPPWLAHKASHEGVICVEKIAGLNDVIRWTSEDPGLHLQPPAGRERRPDRAAAKEGRHEVKVGRFPFIGNGKAIALGEPEGWSRPCSTPRPASCSAPTWSAPR
jgi:dihydrolipoamide dehydrogenase